MKLELREVVTDEPSKKENKITKGQLDVFYYVLPLTFIYLDVINYCLNGLI